VRDRRPIPTFLVVAALAAIGGVARAQYPCPLQWTPLSGPNAPVHALVSFDDGSGPAIYVGGQFTMVGGVAAPGIARWDGAAWSGVGGGMASVGSYLPASVKALAVHDDGTGPALYAAGRFTHAGGVAALRIARWNGSQWGPLSTGLDGGQGFQNAEVQALASFTDAFGTHLAAGGDFIAAGGLYTNHTARWNGLWWTPLGNVGDVVQAFALFDSGSGPQLHAGGNLEPVLRWNGTLWDIVGIPGQGMMWGQGGPRVSALAVADLGAGPRLFAGGDFTVASGVPANRVAMFNGATWQAVGAGFNAPVLALHFWNDGTGPALYAAGTFTSSGATTCNRIAKWNGVTWGPVGTGVTGPSSSYGDTLLASPTSLIFGGFFTGAGSAASPNLVEFRSPVPSLLLSQAAPSSATLVSGFSLAQGHEYYNVFSLSPCPGGPGSGPYGGLCFPDPSVLFQQIAVPLGVLPFHFIASGNAMGYGSFALPPGLALEALTGDVSGGTLTCLAQVVGYTVQ
jgi:hypothetical protein